MKQGQDSSNTTCEDLLSADWYHILRWIFVQDFLEKTSIGAWYMEQ